MMMIDLLLSKGADVNIRIDKKSGYTILMKLAANEILEKEKAENNLEIIQFLIERGANIYLKGYDNKSIFDIIHKSKFTDQILKILNNTNQTVFYNTLPCESEPNETQKLKQSNLRSNMGFDINTKDSIDSNKDIIYEQNTYRLNCCLLF